MANPIPPRGVVEELRRLTAHELSTPSRLRYVVLLLASAAMTAIVAALLVSEPALPTRTAVALSVSAIIGVSWVTFAAWVLSRKRRLLGHHRLIAGRLAVAFSLIFVLGALGVGWATSRVAPLVAAAIGGVMLGIAIATFLRARRRVEALTRRRNELERLLRGGR